MTDPMRIAALALLLLPAACVESTVATNGIRMSDTDGIMPVAGLAPAHNRRMHIIYPNGMPGHPHPGAAGKRAEVVIKTYNAGPSSEAEN